MNIESKIRFKAIVLYVVAGVIVIAMVLFLYGLKDKIQLQKESIDKQHLSLSLTNELISAVAKTQSSASFYVSTRDIDYIRQFVKNIGRVDSLIDTLSVVEPIEKERLRDISYLLAKQDSNITVLNYWFSRENPVAGISKRLQNYDESKTSPTSVVRITQDTIFSAPDKKNFFQRIREVFNPAKDSTVIVTNQRVDTLRIEPADSLAILTEVDKIARIASERYEENIRAIEKQVGQLIASDREISTRISGLLLELHQQTLNSVLNSIAQSERSIRQNYTISIIGGIVALGVILLFIILIIYDVNKGKEAREKLRQVMESRHDLLLSVSHDIKSPLNSILGYLEIGKLQDDDVESMQNSARHILALLENLLEFSSLEQGTLTTTETVFAVDKLCEETGRMFAPLAKAKGLSFSYEGGNVNLTSDYMKIKQIVINLVSNAIKYTREGKICLRMDYSGENLTIQVTDTGVGIPEDKISELFKPFTRVESNNSLSHGSGLGMYVVKGLIDLLDGAIQLNSVAGKGTEVQVRIPCKHEEKAILKQTRKVAVHEDDPATLSVVRDMLLKLGHEVVETGYDIILTDMEMDDISGLDILASAGDIPVILMTGRSDYTALKAKEAGFSGYIQKPFSMENLRNLFGEGDRMENNALYDDFPEEDREEILEIFRNSSSENFGILRNTLETGDFAKAQATCHKMYPMFAQLGYPVEELRRMDRARGHEYENWRSDVVKILAIKV